ncbi:MAG: hypothetical protein R3A47_09075 [Polyangiales bacterium]
MRTWGITGGYHRYFSHRTWAKTSRAFQFALAFLAQDEFAKGVFCGQRIIACTINIPTPSSTCIRRCNAALVPHLGWIFDDTEETRWDKKSKTSRSTRTRLAK